MTHQELVEKLKSEAAEIGSLNKEEKELLSMIVDALETRIPKKPIIRETEDYFGYVKYILCPNCKKIEFGFNQPCFCERCGQAIDWKDNE